MFFVVPRQVFFAMLFVLSFSTFAQTYSSQWIISEQAQLKMLARAPTLNPKVLQLAFNAMNCAMNSQISHADRLTVIDYSLPSTQPRLWVFDLNTSHLLFHELVAHGKNSGKNHANYFSNKLGSKQSSLGLFLTKDTYYGSNGYSLRMEGLDQGFNDQAMQRAIVFHGAPYVNNNHIKKFGHLGRSWGCPVVNSGIAKKVIDAIKGDQFVFSYYPDKKWLTVSSLLNCKKTNYVASR